MSQWPQTHSVEITPWGKKIPTFQQCQPLAKRLALLVPTAISIVSSRVTTHAHGNLFFPTPLICPNQTPPFFFRLSHPALNSTRPQKFCLMSIGSPFDCCDASYTGAAVELNDESPKGCRKVRVGSCHSSRSSRVLDSLRRPADVVGKCCEPASKRVHSQRETCTRGGIRAVPAAS